MKKDKAELISSKVVRLGEIPIMPIGSIKEVIDKELDRTDHTITNKAYLLKMAKMVYEHHKNTKPMKDKF